MNCKNCGYDMTTENYSYCPMCGHKVKKHNIVGLWFKILLIFILFSLVERLILILSPTISSSIKYGAELYIEVFVSFFIILLLVFFNNTYILKEKKVGFFKGILIGWPLLLISFLSILFGFEKCFNNEFVLSNFVASILLFGFVGVYEELMCRGFIQNEFIERYGKNRKQVITSIVCSSLIFGGMHITNLFIGQDMFSTILQVMQTTILGMLLGGVYYRTKNIKIPIFLHAFYDFALSLSTNNIYWEDRVLDVGNITFMVSIISTIMICAVNLIAFIIMFRNIKINPLVKEKKYVNKKKDENIFTFGILGCVAIVYLCSGINSFIVSKNEDKYKEEEKNTITFDYKKINKDNYELIYTTSINKYNIHCKNNLLFELNKKGELVIYNDSLDKKEVLSDNVLNFVIFEENNNYIIGINTKDKLLYLELNEDELINIDTIKDKIKIYHIPYSRNIGYIKDIESNKKNIVLKTINPSLNIMLDGTEFKIIK